MQPTNVLPSTPEVNEETSKISSPSSHNTEYTDAPTKKLKSQSLPRETDSKQMHAFNESNKSSSCTDSTEIIKTPQKTTIYVNKNISKSHDFDKSISGATNITIAPLTDTPQKKSSEDSSLIKKFWHRNTKKQKEEEGALKGDDELEEHGDEIMEHKSILQINSPESADILVKRPKTGPAARQRVVPKDIEEPIKERASIIIGQTPPVEVAVKPVTKPIPIARTTVQSSPARVFIHKSQEDLISKPTEAEIKAHSISPPKTSWQEQHQLKGPKICGLSPLQQKIADMASDSPSKKKSNMGKSNSFRIFTTENTSFSNLEKANNLPSLPNLTQSSTEDEQEESIQFSSLTEQYTVKKRLSQEGISEIGKPQPRFEINDYNLIKQRKENGVEIVGVLKKKNIVVKGAEELPQASAATAGTNISQIEENIDKLMKSSVITMLKNANSIEKEDDDIDMEVIETPSTPEKIPNNESPKPAVRSVFKKLELNETEVALREKRVSSVLERFEAKFTPEAKSKHPIKQIKSEIVDELQHKSEFKEPKPPKPPTTVRVATKVANENVTEPAPSSPTKIPISSFEEAEPRRSVIGDNDDRKVILQRRTSVSEERLKFERRISGGSNEEPATKFERKKSQSEEGLDIQKVTKKQNNISDDDETHVILRKKSNDSDSNKKDDTPELMKVFARRSLKIHVDDDDNAQENNQQKLGNSMDSDKENQSSSEEKLDKITQNTSQNISNNQNNNISTNSSINAKTSSTNGIKEKDDNVIPDPEIQRKSNLLAPKPFGTPSRFSNVVKYRNSTAFTDVRKNLQQKASSNNNTTGNGGTNTSTINASSNSQDVKNNNSNNNNNITNNNNNNTTNVRHTIGAPLNDATKKIDSGGSEEIEFKGILQRRAEWEKRAKEGFK